MGYYIITENRNQKYIAESLMKEQSKGAANLSLRTAMRQVYLNSYKQK